MSTIEANTLKPISGSSTLTLGESGDTVNLGTGVTAGTGFGADLDPGSGEVVVNESGASVDFRVESNTDANCFIVDGSGDKVGMGLAVPEGKLHIFTADASVGPNGDADELVIENGTSGAGVGISLLSATNGEARINFGDSNDDNVGSIFYNHGNNTLQLVTNTTVGLEIASNQYIKAIGVYNQSAGDSANVVIDGSGNLYRSTSALKYKQDVRDLESIDISSFRPVRYKSKSPKDDPEKDFIGFIADEFHDAGLTELVSYGQPDEEGNPVVEGFNYDRLTAVLTKALQEANTKIATLEAENTDIKARLTALENA